MYGTQTSAKTQAFYHEHAIKLLQSVGFGPDAPLTIPEALRIAQAVAAMPDRGVFCFCDDPEKIILQAADWGIEAFEPAADKIISRRTGMIPIVPREYEPHHTR